MSNKVRTTLTLNRDVVNRAKELDINLSAAAERGIIEYIKELSYINTNLRGKVNNSNSEIINQNIESQTNSLTNSQSKVGLLRFA